MYRIDNNTAKTTLEAPTAPGSNPDHYFTNGNPLIPESATVWEAEWANMVQEEIAGAVIAAGLALDKADRTQLTQAITLLLNGRYANQDIISATGNWTAPAGVNRVHIELWGAGAGASWGDGQAGAAGGYVAGFFDVVPLQVYNLTIGVGGTAALFPIIGGDGGSSSFPVFGTAEGGQGANIPGGGSSSEATALIITGGIGDDLTVSVTSAQGGAAPRGGPGGGAGTAGQVPGGGGGATDLAGFGGGNGLCVIRY